MTENHEIAVYEDDERALAPLPPPVAAAMQQADVMAQLDAAHRYPRSVTRFLREAETLVTMDRDIAASCMYAVPRGGKVIEGPSVRLAEMAASAWGNLQIGARPIETGEQTVTCEGVAWDMERNVRVAIRTERRITGKPHQRADMAALAAAAGNSIAMRNAVFRVIPRAYIDRLYAAARRVAVGDQKTLVARRDEFMARILKAGVTQERVFLRLGVKGVDDITLDHLATLTGLGTAIQSGDITLDEAFPPVVAAPAPEQEGQRISMRKAAPVAAPPEPPPHSEAAPQSHASNVTVASLRKSFLSDLAKLSEEQRAAFWSQMPAGYTDVAGVQACKELTPMREASDALAAFIAGLKSA